jgi:hypothetical protein
VSVGFAATGAGWEVLGTGNTEPTSVAAVPSTVGWEVLAAADGESCDPNPTCTAQFSYYDGYYEIHYEPHCPPCNPNSSCRPWSCGSTGCFPFS